MTLTLLGCRDGRAVVRLEGAVGDRELERVQALLHAISDAGVHRFVIDVTLAHTSDLRLVRLLHRVQHDVGRHGGDVDLRGVGPEVVPTWQGVTLREAFALHAWSRPVRRPVAPTLQIAVDVPVTTPGPWPERARPDGSRPGTERVRPHDARVRAVPAPRIGGRSA
jgi:anti-anti-sigma regulatory factor